MEGSPLGRGAVVDQRLAPAGLTRLFGAYGAGRVSVLVLAAALVIGACAGSAASDAPPVAVGLALIVAVTLVASEFGIRAGVRCALAAIAAMTVVAALGWGDDGAATIAGRTVVLLFLAILVGRATERAAHSRRLLEQVLEATTDAIYVKDLDGRYLIVNSATAQLIGRPGREIIGRTNGELLPDLAGDIAARDNAVLDSETSAGYEIAGRFGERDRVLSVTKSPFRDAGGAPIGSLGIARDITEERRRQEAATRRRIERERQIGEAQERFRRAFEDAPIGMAVANLDGRFLEVNQALCAITGYTPQQLTGTTFTTITHPEDVAADLAVMRALVAGELASSVDEKRYLRPDGTVVWVARSVTLIRDADGRPLHLLDQIQDITERRRFEHELRRLADHDPLTGLLNRRRFEQEIDRHLADVARYGPRGALLVLDLDHFKHVNDALGHHAGDELIVVVARLLQERLRGSDTLARLGGDEFAVLLPHGDADDAEQVAHALMLAVREHASVTAGGRRHRMTTSIGIAPFGRAGTGGGELLIAADLAMYRAKAAGRDRYVVAAARAVPPDSPSPVA
jgi:diguanylate cyclase (GGDEF)-like protein/PAS domain S-box-containing protein